MTKGEKLKNNLTASKLLVATALISTSVQASAYSYSVSDLGTLGNYSGAYSISDNGNYIVGDSDTNSGLRATLFSQGSPPVALQPGPYNPQARSYSVNNSGQAVGVAIFSPWDSHAALLTTNNSAVDLGTLGGNSSQANSINNLGQIAGISSTSINGWSHATLFGLGLTPIDLGVLPSGLWSNATAINNLGLIVGASQSVWGTHATLFSTTGGPIDLDPLETYAISSAFGVNDKGQIVGVRQYAAWTPNLGNTTLQRAMLFSSSFAPVDLGDLGGAFSRSNDVNSAGQIVGMSTIAGEQGVHAALFGLGHSPIDLNDLVDPLSGWLLEEAMSIDEQGDIVGFGHLNGEIKAFLATPIPEPKILTLVLVSLGIMSIFVRPKRPPTV